MFFDDPMTRVKRERTKRQKQAFFYAVSGLLLGGGLMNLLIELSRGVQ